MHRLRFALPLLVVLSGCGSGGSHQAASPPSPTPTLSADEQQTLADLQAIQFPMYATPVMIANYVFESAGPDYDKGVFSLSFGGLSVDEFNAVPNFDPTSSVCIDYTGFRDPCRLVGSSTKGRQIFIGQSAVYPEPLYMRFATTGFIFHQGGLRTPVVRDLLTVADSIAVVTPRQVIELNREAASNAQRLHDTAPQRIDFKTYVPQKGIQRFQLDKKSLGNGTDPLNPYLWLHFARTAIGNQAFEFVTVEFRDAVPLSTSHCGAVSPELGDPGGRCTLLFRTPKGDDVYAASFQTMRFDLGSTRVVVELDMRIAQLTQTDVNQFVDSFVEVDPKSLL